MNQSADSSNKFYKLIIISFIALITFSSNSPAEELRVAVASNFSETLKLLAENFSNKTGHKVTVITGSTGKLYAQIINGAPYDAFFSADLKRPQRLENEGAALKGTRFTYAIGKIILWSPDKDYVDNDGNILTDKNYRYLAIANPKLAPYGKAAQEILQQRGIWSTLHGRMVRGENIGQTYQFVKSANAKLGFVAYSQVKRPGHLTEGSFWEVPQSLYNPIEQQAVQIRENSTTEDFLSYVRSDEALQIIQSFGYGVNKPADFANTDSGNTIHGNADAQ